MNEKEFCKRILKASEETSFTFTVEVYLVTENTRARKDTGEQLSWRINYSINNEVIGYEIFEIEEGEDPDNQPYVVFEKVKKEVIAFVQNNLRNFTISSGYTKLNERNELLMLLKKT